MACPGGCVNGGGQPIQPSSVRSWIDLRVEGLRQYMKKIELCLLESPMKILK